MKNPPTESQARISEIFSSLQGEGPHVGERHLFIRFEECHWACVYCDELDKTGTEMSLEAVQAEVMRLEKESGPHAAVSLTGGEPLLYLNFLRPLMRWLKAENFRIYLETNGILWQSLAEVIAWCDCIAMDLKPSSVTHDRNCDPEHEKFLEIAGQKELFVKIVVSKDLDLREFETQMQIVARVAPRIPVVLQPLSGPGGEGHEDPELMSLILKLQRLGLRRHLDMRIIPRFHRILNLR